MSCSIEEPNTTANGENKSSGQQSTSSSPQSLSLSSTVVKPLGTSIMIGGGGSGIDHYAQANQHHVAHHHHHHHHHMQQQQQQQQQQTLITLQPPTTQSQPLQIIQPNVLNNGAGTTGSNATYTTLSNASGTGVGGGSVGGVPTKMHLSVAATNPTSTTTTVSGTTAATTAAKLTGGHFLITTLGPNKLVTLQPASSSSTAPSSGNNNITIINGNATTTTTTTATTPQTQTSTNNQQSSTTTTTTNSSSSTESNQTNNPTTTTITLTSPPPSSATTSSTTSSSLPNGQPASILFPLQTSQQQYFIDASNQLSSTTTSVNLFSPLSSSTNSYYTFQPTTTYPQTTTTTIITTQNSSGTPTTTTTTGNTAATSTTTTATANQQQSPNRMSIDQQDQQQANQNQQQQQQPQQTLYVMYDSAPNASDLDNGQMDFEGHVSHTAQAAPITVQWLIDNFEPAEGCSLRRSTLYNYYLLHCTEQRIEPVNPASFGKLIRSVFLGLRTRRLGTRGNSKYHYYGIRVKMNSALNQIAEDSVMTMRNHPYSMSPTGSPSPSSQSNGQQNTPPSSSSSSQPPASKRVKTSSGTSSSGAYETASTTTIEYKPSSLLTTVTAVDPQQQQQQQQQANLTTVVLTNGAATINQLSNGKQQLLVNPNSITKIVKTGSGKTNGTINDQQVEQQFKTAATNEQQQTVVALNNQNTTTAINDAAAAGAATAAAATTDQEDLNQIPLGIQMPDFGSIQVDENTQLPANCSAEDVKKFEELYKQHCERILDLVVALKFNSIQSLWLRFWRSNDSSSDPSSSNNSGPDSVSYYESQLNSERFFALCECPTVYEFVIHCDFQFYQFCIEILIPDVFGHLPHSLVTLMRNLSKSVESWLIKSLGNPGVSERMRAAKLAIIRAFSMALKRYTSLSHLIQTVKNTMQNQDLLNHMSTDINKVDFSYIREQLRWTCDWENVDETVNRFENDFKEALRNHDSKSMESWLAWIDKMVTSYMQQHENSGQSYSKMAKSFILTWSLLCDTTVRDLTLRSAPTFGSFHLVRLLYAEYINYLIERKIAEHYSKPPLQIMCPSLL